MLLRDHVEHTADHGSIGANPQELPWLTMAQRSQRFGFDLPDDFPLGPLEAVHARVSDGPKSIHANNQGLWSHWGGGCNGTLYRFVAAASASDEWVTSSRLSVSPPIDERVRQEVALFSFFTNALSALECLAYGLSAIGEFLNPAFSVTAAPKTIKFPFAATTFAGEFPNDRLGPELQSAHQSQEMADLRTIRNTLSHRAAPGRAFSEVIGGTSGSGSTGWLGTNLGPMTTSQPRVWVAQTLHGILDAADDFTRSYF